MHYAKSRALYLIVNENYKVKNESNLRERFDRVILSTSSLVY